MDLQSVYLRLPHTGRQLAVVGASAFNRATRFGRAYQAQIETIEATQYAAPEQHRALQADGLRALLAEAVQGTEYYREMYARYSAAELDEIATNLNMSALPELPKAVLKSEVSRFYNHGRRRFLRSRTSGSTGSPLVVEYDRVSVQRRLAFMDHHRQWFGAPLRARALRVGGRMVVPSSRQRPPFWMHNPFENQLLLSTYHLNASNRASVLRAIHKFGPQVIDGYPTAIMQIARFLVEAGEQLPTLLGAVSTAETLSPGMRAEIEGGLGVPLLDYYSASEGTPFVQQCLHGRYHVAVASGIVEILDEAGRSVASGETGELVVTSFTQWKTPLIRYRTGDLATVATPEECPCGRTLPLIEGVLGRVEDLVHTADGRRIGMFSYRTLKFVSGITEAQIQQRSTESFHVVLVLDGSRSRAEVERGVLQIFTDVLGYLPTIEFSVEEQIPRGANGKFRSVVRLF